MIWAFINRESENRIPIAQHISKLSKFDMKEFNVLKTPYLCTYVLYVCTYVHACILIYVRTYIHVCIHTSINACVHAYVHVYVHSYIVATGLAWCSVAR